MIRNCLFIVAVLASQLSMAQGGTKAAVQELFKLPIAPTPNAAALGKFGDIPVGLSTGIPSISVPFYSYENKFKKLNFDISISYHASGHKVEDMASSCGLGWALNAGGMITRTVKGLPDDKLWGYLNSDTLPYYYTQPGDFFSYMEGVSAPIGLNTGITQSGSSAAYYLVKNIQERTLDGEADMFSFTAGSITGKFVIRKDLQVQLITQANVAVAVDFTPNNNSQNYINGFTILDKNSGVSYVFNVKEEQQPFAINVYTQYQAEPNTSIPTYISNWYLSNVISADKLDTIKLTYEGYGTMDMSYEAGFSESSSQEITGSPVFPSMGGSFSHTWMFTRNARRIKSIVLPDGTNADFYYTFSRQDYTGDQALTSVEIGNSGFKKIYNLSYGYFESPACPGPEAACSVYGSTNDYYKRLKLLSVQQSDGVNTLPAYTFEYNATPLPTRKSKAQDYWGYYNGQPNSTLMPSYEVAGLGYVGTANRESYEQYTKACVLEKLTYPTGGYTQLYYEINKSFGPNYQINKRTDNVWASQVSYNVFKEVPFANRNNTSVSFFIKLNADLSQDPNGPQIPYGCNCTYRIESTDNSYTYDVTATIEQFVTGHPITLSLPLNKTYQVKFTSECVTLPATYDMNITYDYSIVPLDKPIGGLRVAKTEDYDGVIANPVTTNYTYLGVDGMSSGEYQHLPNFNFYRTTTLQWTMPEPGQGLPYATAKYYLNSSSSPNQSLSYYRGSPVIYKRVKVDKTNNNASNGYSIHTFTSFATTQVQSSDYPYLQQQDLEWRQGLQLTDSFFTATDQLVKAVENEYDYFESNPATASNRNLLTGLIQHDDLNTLANIVYGARGYYLVSGRNELKRTKTILPDGTNSVVTINDFFYNTSNYLLTRQKTVNSKGETLESRFYYPADYNTTAIPNNVAVHNGEAELVSKEDWIKKGSTWYLQGASVNDYQSYNSVVRKSKIIGAELADVLDESIVGVFSASQLKRHASFKDQVQIVKYDTYGRYTEVSQIGKPVSSVIWAPQLEYPVAQSINATADEIYSNSFEQADGTSDASAPTGWRSHPGDYTVNFTLPVGTTKQFLATYWSFNGVKWEYREEAYTAPGKVLTGNKIDEVRVYPKTAQMITYTYHPMAGITSQCDANNRIQHYLYDGFGRLVLVRDQDKNILKKICYNYSGQTENCTGFYNVQKSGSFTRNNCSAGTGSSVNYVVSANTYFSAISQADADAMAQNEVNQNGQAYANANGTCVFYNVQKSGNFTRNNCGAGFTGSMVTYTVAANTYNSTVSQAAADQLAQDDVNNNGQTYANTNGTCTSTCHPGNCFLEGKRCVNNVCETGIKVYTASDYNPVTGRWDCTYHYEFSDSSWSQNYVEDSWGECVIW